MRHLLMALAFLTLVLPACEGTPATGVRTTATPIPSNQSAASNATSTHVLEPTDTTIQVRDATATATDSASPSPGISKTREAAEAVKHTEASSATPQEEEVDPTSPPASPTPEPTETPPPTATEEVVEPTAPAVEENLTPEMQQVNANIDAYLNGEIPIPTDPAQLPRDEMGTYGLGEYRAWGENVYLVVMNLGAYEKNGHVVVMVGTVESGMPKVNSVIASIDETIYQENGVKIHTENRNMYRNPIPQIDSSKIVELMNQSVGELMVMNDFYIEEIDLSESNAPKEMKEEVRQSFFPHIQANSDLVFDPSRRAVSSVAEVIIDNSAMTYGDFHIYK